MMGGAGGSAAAQCRSCRCSSGGRAGLGRQRRRVGVGDGGEALKASHPPSVVSPSLTETLK